MSPYLKKPFTYTVSLIVLLPLTLLCLTFLLPLSAYLSNPLTAAAAARACGGGTAAGVTVRAAPAAEGDDGVGSQRRPELSVLVGVHTMPGKHSRRHLIRMAYALQQTAALRAAARVDVRFALCARPMLPEHRAFVALEARAYGDVLVLDCAESAEQGKTYTYFASLPAMLGSGSGGGGRPYDYVMKVDDDTFLRLDALVETLRAAPREDMYCGAGLPFHDRQFPPFMLGMGYLLSWDLVEWIASSDMVREEAMGRHLLTCTPCIPSCSSSSDFQRLATTACISHGN
jgi:hypothetical protein